MITKEQKKDLSGFIEYWGIANQTVKAVEELSELQRELCKGFYDNLYALSADIKDNIISEMADVKIMLAQLQEMFEINDEVLKEQIAFKIERTKNAVEVLKKISG